MSQDISLEEIIEARDKVARIIVKYGERYMPIFIRLDEEVEKRKEYNRYLEKVRRIAAGN